MDLINFSSFFEIFAALNLGYASFDYFRNLLNNSIFKRGSAYKKLNESRIKVDLITTERKDDLKGVDKIASAGQSRLVSRTRAIDDEYKNHKNSLLEAFKPISLSFALYSITVLIIAAFQAQIEVGKTIKICEFVDCGRQDLTMFVFLLALITSSYSFIIFFSSVSKRILSYRIKMSVTITIFIYLLGVIFSYLMVHFINELSATEIILISVISPMFLYCVFVSFYFFKNEDFIGKTREEYLKAKEKSFTAQIKFSLLPRKKSLLLVICYLVLILFFTSPISIYFSSTNEFFQLLIINTIVLMNPILLYIFLASRVFIHQKYYERKYNSLYKDYAVKFEALTNWSEDTQV